MQTWKDEFLLGFKFSRVQTARKGFPGGVMFEPFMGDFSYRDSTSRQVQLFLLHLSYYSTYSGNKTLFLILNIYYEHAILALVL